MKRPCSDALHRIANILESFEVILGVLTGVVVVTCMFGILIALYAVTK